MLFACLGTSLAVLLLAVGDVLMSRAMKRLGPFEWFGPLSLLRFGAKAITVIWFWMAILFMAGHFFLWMAVLRYAPLSVVGPVSAVQYVFSAVLARLVLGEQINLLRWVGTGVIVVGVVIIAVGA